MIRLGNANYTDATHHCNLTWYTEALILLGEDGDENLRARAMIRLGNALYTDLKYEGTDRHMEAPALVLGPYGYVNLEARAMIGLGNAGYTDATHSSNLTWFTEALAILGENGDKNLRGQANSAIYNARTEPSENDIRLAGIACQKLYTNRGNKDLQKVEYIEAIMNNQEEPLTYTIAVQCYNQIYMED